MDNPELYTTPTHHERSTTTLPSKRSNQLTFIVVGVIAALTVVFLFIRGGRQETPPPTSEAVVVVVPTPTTPPPTPTVDSCRSATQAYRTMLEDKEKNLQWELSADIALSTVNSPEICDSDRAHFARRYVHDALQALWGRRFDASREAQQRAIDYYYTIQRTARPFKQAYGVELPSSLEVGQGAAQRGFFLLALDQYDVAYEQGSFKIENVPLLRDYISNLYNYGWYGSQDPTNPHYEEALTYLAASAKLATQLRTGQGEAATRLTSIFGPDETKWPEPKKTPFQ